GLGQGQPAGGQRGAGERAAGDGGPPFGGSHAVPGEDVVDPGPHGVGDVAEEHVLPGGEPHGGAHLGDDGAQPRSDPLGPGVGDAAVQDLHAEEPAAIALVVPTEVVVGVVEHDG